MERNAIDGSKHGEAANEAAQGFDSKLPDRFMERFINDKAEKLRHRIRDDDANDPAKRSHMVSDPNSPIDVFIQMSTDENPEV